MVSEMTNTGSTTRPADRYATTASKKRQPKMTGVLNWGIKTNMEGMV
jgi:hypothetical protein